MQTLPETGNAGRVQFSFFCSNKANDALRNRQLFQPAFCIRFPLKKPSIGVQDAINAMNFCPGMMESAETGKVVKF